MYIVNNVLSCNVQTTHTFFCNIKLSSKIDSTHDTLSYAVIKTNTLLYKRRHCLYTYTFMDNPITFMCQFNIGTNAFPRKCFSKVITPFG